MGGGWQKWAGVESLGAGQQVGMSETMTGAEGIRVQREGNTWGGRCEEQ